MHKQDFYAGIVCHPASGSNIVKFIYLLENYLNSKIIIQFFCFKYNFKLILIIILFAIFSKSLWEMRKMFHKIANNY